MTKKEITMSEVGDMLEYIVANMATKDDIKNMATKDDIAELKTELKGDIVDLRKELKGDIADLRKELKGDIAELKADISRIDTELKSINNRLEILTDRAKSNSGFAVEIDDMRDDVAKLTKRVAALETTTV